MSLLSTASVTRWTIVALSLVFSLSYAFDLQQPVNPLAQNISQAQSEMTTIAPDSTSELWAAAYPQLVLFGDSITQGSHSTVMPKLIESYSRRLDVINRGFSGYNTTYALPILPLLYPDPPAPHQPRIALMTVFFGHTPPHIKSTPKDHQRILAPPSYPDPPHPSQPPASPLLPASLTPPLPTPLGANDAVLPSFPQHVPLTQYTSHLRTIATHPGVLAHRTRVIFITPPPIDEHQVPPHLDQRNTEHTRLYAASCVTTARALGIPCVDIWTAFMRRAGWAGNTDGHGDGNQATTPLPGSRKLPPNEVLRRLLSDGLHLTAEGYAVVLEELQHTIREEVPELLPERMPMVVPDWQVVMGVTD